MPRIAVVTADGQQHLVEGNLASMIEVLLQEQSTIEACGEKVHVKLNCIGGTVRADICKRGVKLNKVA